MLPLAAHSLSTLAPAALNRLRLSETVEMSLFASFSSWSFFVSLLNHDSVKPTRVSLRLAFKCDNKSQMTVDAVERQRELAAKNETKKILFHGTFYLQLTMSPGAKRKIQLVC